MQQAPKDASFLKHSAFWPFKVVQRRLFWYQSNRTRVCDFLLVRYCDYRPILDRFWDTATYCLSNALHSSIGQNIKSLACPKSGVRSECEKLQMAITYKLCLLMHQIRTSQAPSYLSDIVTQTATVSSRSRLRSGRQWSIRTTTDAIKIWPTSFFVRCTAAWNSLPPILQQISNTASFKRHLKSFLYQLAYPD